MLNNVVHKDNRIPPYGMNYETARLRNALPVPATQYGGGPGQTYDYFDTVTLNPPQGAANATIERLYQPTSWEYIQFLDLGNQPPPGSFLENEGTYMLEAWLNPGMAEPYVMASATWGNVQLKVTSALPGVADSRAGAVSSCWATWQTQSPNKRGQGGTPVDSYTATTNVTAAGYTWDGAGNPANFTLQ